MQAQVRRADAIREGPGLSKHRHETFRASLHGEIHEQARKDGHQPIQPTQRTDDERESPGIAFRASRRAIASEPNEIIYSGPVITHHVQENGNVEYKRDGAALMVDEGRTVRMWVQDRDAIEIGLRLC